MGLYDRAEFGEGEAMRRTNQLFQIVTTVSSQFINQAQSHARIEFQGGDVV
jgi:hypothetical protein